MEGDRPPSRSIFSDPVFQSTPSVWRETIASNINHTLELSFQSTPSAWRETSRRQCLYPCCGEFQSTPSAWRETRCAGGVFGKSTISIHSLRMEGDYDNTRRTGDTHHFNPLPPHGGRLPGSSIVASSYYFNPLPPHGGRRLDSITHRPSPVFQSTPSAWRETFIFFFLPVLFFYFNPLPPHGGRPTRLL